MAKYIYNIIAEHRPGQEATIQYSVEADTAEQAISEFIDQESLADVLAEWSVYVQAIRKNTFDAAWYRPSEFSDTEA